jgi:hypothetical protein
MKRRRLLYAAADVIDEIAPPGFERFHLILNGGTRNPCFDSLDQPANFAFHLRQISCDAAAARVLFGRLSVQLAVKFVNECPDHFWSHQLILESIQDLGFQRISPHSLQIVTRSLVSDGRASIVRLADLENPPPQVPHLSRPERR